MSIVSAAALFAAQTADAIYARGLQIASVFGLPVTTWRAGDPTKSLYWYLAEMLESREGVTSEYIKGGFLSTAEGDWAKVNAYETYGVIAEDATFAESIVVVHNTLGGYYPLAPGDLTFKNSATNKTYHSTSGPIDNTTGLPLIALSAGVVARFDVIADEAGSDSSAAVNEIDSLVTTLRGVVVVSSTTATAQDEQAIADLKTQALATLGALSPDGPADAYEYVARNPALTGTRGITRAQSAGDNPTGHVTVYLAGPSGAVSGDDVLAADDAFELWATPLCITPTGVSATNHVINVAGEIVDVSAPLPDDYITIATAALAALFASSTIPIGDASGNVRVAVSLILATIHKALPMARGIDLTSPPDDVFLEAGEVAVLGGVSL